MTQLAQGTTQVPMSVQYLTADVLVFDLRSSWKEIPELDEASIAYYQPVISLAPSSTYCVRATIGLYLFTNPIKVTLWIGSWSATELP